MVMTVQIMIVMVVMVNDDSADARSNDDIDNDCTQTINVLIWQ